MKKLFAILLASAMAATLSVGAAAATELDESPEKGNGAGDYAIGVGGKYNAGTAADDKISVDIAWEAMDFTYTAGDSTYHPDSHTTTTADGSWSTNKAGITVTNHSNVRIDAGFSFAGTTGITGTFYDGTAEGERMTYTENTDKKLSLISGEDKTTEGETYTTPAATIYFGVDPTGASISAGGSIGTITVHIAKDEKVYTGEELQAALNKVAKTGGTVTLGADVTASTLNPSGNIQGVSIEPSCTNVIVLDLNGKTLTGGIVVRTSATDTKITVKNGTVSATFAGEGMEEMGVITNYSSELELNDVTVDAPSNAALANCLGTVYVSDCTFNGGVTPVGSTFKRTILNAGGISFAGAVSGTGTVRCVSGAEVLLKAGCQCTFDGATEATTVTEDTGYKSSSDHPDWIEFI